MTSCDQAHCTPSCLTGYDMHVHVPCTNIWFVHLPFRTFQMWCWKFVPGTCFASRKVWNEWADAECSAVWSSSACWRSLSVLAMTSIHSNWYVVWYIRNNDKYLPMTSLVIRPYVYHFFMVQSVLLLSGIKQRPANVSPVVCGTHMYM